MPCAAPLPAKLPRMTTQDIVSKLWNLCNALKDDGVTYHQYVTELTYLLFLKMADETGKQGDLPEGYRWPDLAHQGKNCLTFYKKLLKHLERHGSPLVQEIFASATTSVKKDSTLSAIIREIERLDWYSARREGLGDLYEGLLEKNASEKKSGAGQYFTPRVLIDSMVAVMRPTLGDVIQDPAAGTGGFLIAAHHYLASTHDLGLLTAAQKRKLRRNTFFGMEHVQDTQRLALMNLMLHGIDSSPHAGGIHYGDTLGLDGQALAETGATLILANPPFGTKKGGGLPSRTDLPYPTSNKQFCFLQHIYLALKPGGRAAVVLPDNVLFENNVGVEIRRDLMEKCNLHTILRLPPGIFYAPGVKTNVLFFTRGVSDKRNTKEVWVYDLRTDMTMFGKRNALAREHFSEFEIAYGDDPIGSPSSMKKRREGDRWRRFTRKVIAERGDNLDFTWLPQKKSSSSSEEGSAAALTKHAVRELEGALDDLAMILAELGSGLQQEVDR